jgi:type II secretion system protein G
MAPRSPAGNRHQGFTLVELLLVLLIVALLASLTAPVVTNSVQRARESSLKQSLQVVRKAIDDYYADTGAYPPTLEALVEKRYIRKLPKDPVTDRVDSWVLVRSREGQSGAEGGIVDVQSGSEEKSSDGTPYRDL